ncbi:transcriptional regulator [Pseudactinotalea sp. HY160]|nr:transcriptional regulator [Pseudactinotalea sp. HY160]
MPQQRVFFRDVKPYEVPEKLEDLKGPVGGVVDLPHTVLWAPGCGRVDLDAEGGAGLAYRAVLSEGTLADQVAVVNRDRLMAVWPGLLLPRRVRELWEARFPELRAVVSA